MNLKRARYILAIYECGGITAAAKKLFVSQPSMSQTLRLVEQEIGAAVFERGVTPPKLTYAGEMYLDTARAMMEHEENLDRILSGIRSEERGRLRVGLSIQRGMQLLPLVLPAFSRSYPDVDLSLAESGSERLEKMVDEGEVDFAFITTEPTHTSLEYILLENETYVLLTGKDNVLLERHAPGDCLSIHEAKDQRFMSLKPGHNIRQIQDRLFARCGISPAILAETDSLEGAIRITAACSCCMLCPNAFVRDNPAIAGSGVSFRVEELMDAERHFYACYRRERYLPQYARAFIKLVQEATRASCQED